MVIDYQYLYKLVIVFLYAGFATYVSLPYFDRKLKKFGFVVGDKYKTHKEKIPTMGGLAILVGVLISLALSQLLMHRYQIGDLYIFYFIVLVYALYGLVDDMFSFKHRYDKIAVLLILSFPIASLITNTQLFGFELHDFYALLLAPFFIMIVANLVNVYSGYNGLASGLSIILLLVAGLKSYLVYGLNNIMYLLPVLAGLLVFYPWNWYPAKMLEGNVGAFIFGSTLGAFLIVNHLEVFGTFILIPHILNFLLDTYVLAIKKIPDVKFGSVRKDWTLQIPFSVRHKSLKFMLCYYVRLREWQATLILLSVTLLFSIVGVIWL